MRVRGPIGIGPILIHRYDYDNDFVDKIPHALVPGAPLGLKRGERVAAFNSILNWSIDTLNFHPLFVYNDYENGSVDVMCPREGDAVLMQVWFNDLRERR